MAEGIRPPKTVQHLEDSRRWLRGEVPGPSIAELIGFAPVAFEVGTSTFELTAAGRHANPMGTLHGGILCDLGDITMGTAMASTLEDDESFTTVDLTAKFFKPIWESKVTAVARVTKRTRKLGFVVCDVTDEAGSLVASLFSTCMVLSGEQAKDR